MKKIFYVIAACAVMALTSCNNGLSPEGQKAWDNFKQLAATFESMEACDASYADEAAFAEGHAAFVEATKTMQEADSFKTMCETCAATIQKAQEAIQTRVEVEQAAEEIEQAAEEVESEE